MSNVVFLPDDPQGYRQHSLAPFSYETQTPLGKFPLIAVSLAYELELAGLITLLELAGIPPLREDRDERHPLILLGGPLTFSKPAPSGAFCGCDVAGGGRRYGR